MRLAGYFLADGTITAGDKDPNARNAMHSKMPMDVTQDVKAAARRSPTDDPCFDVAGNVTRIERTFSVAAAK